MATLTPIYNWRWDESLSAFVAPATDLVRLRVPDGQEPSLLIPHAASITDPGVADLVSHALCQGAELLRLLADPARQVPALRERITQLEAERATR